MNGIVHRGCLPYEFSGLCLHFPKHFSIPVPVKSSSKGHKKSSPEVRGAISFEGNLKSKAVV